MGSKRATQEPVLEGVTGAAEPPAEEEIEEIPRTTVEEQALVAQPVRLHSIPICLSFIPEQLVNAEAALSFSKRVRDTVFEQK